MISPESAGRYVITAATVTALGVAGLTGWGLSAYNGRVNLRSDFVGSYLGDTGCLTYSAYGGAEEGRIDVDGVQFPGETTIELQPNPARIANKKLPLRFVLEPTNAPGQAFKAADPGTERVLRAYDC